MARAYDNPLTASLRGIRELFGPQQLEGALTDDMRVDGRTCLVTGASAGLGFAIATQLAERGARVITVSRSGIPEKGEEIARLSGSDSVEMLHCDLSDLKQIHQLADQLRERAERIDILVDNAGVMTPWARETAQGFDAMFATNVFAKMILSLRLLRDGTIRNTTFAEAPRASGEPLPRIVFVSSDSHRGASAIEFEGLGAYRDYGIGEAMKDYGYSKLVLNTFVQELARKLAPAGRIDVAVHAMCPGAVDSNIARDAPAALRGVLKPLFKLFFRSPAVAAKPVVYMCTASDFEHETGRYLHMFNPKPMDEKCYDAATGEKLWQHSASLLRSIGVWPEP